MMSPNMNGTPEERSGDSLTIEDAVALANLLVTLIHDIRNLTAAIQIKGDILKMKPDKYDVTGLWNDLTPHLDKLDRLTLSARDAVRWMRTPAEVVDEPTDVIASSKTCIALLKRNAKSKEIRFHFDVSEESIPVPLPKDLLEQGILIRLFENAVMHGVKGSTVVARFDRKGEKVRLQIAGRGEKVREDYVDRLVEDTDRETLRRRGTAGELGLGFGLYIANRSALRFGGSIQVGTRPDPKAAQEEQPSTQFFVTTLMLPSVLENTDE
ncbi:hypothetical protein GF324_12425 [bacterium]|nr:hypothetical protein [bacterium]